MLPRATTGSRFAANTPNILKCTSLMTGWKYIDQLNITCASALSARDSNSSKPLSDNNSDWHWAGLAKRDGVYEDRWMAFLQTQPRLLITRQEVPMEWQTLKTSSLS